MKILKYLLYTLLGIGALWLLLCLFAKKSYKIERKADIEAPRETVYAQVGQFKNFTNWSPWHFMDPNMKVSIQGTDGEVGALYQWDSQNKNVGKGYQKLLAKAPGRLDYEVDFGLGPSPVYFRMEGDSQQTSITWGMDMHLPFLMRAGGLFTDLNTFVGKDYENGLANLKKYCEALNPKEYQGYRVTAIERPNTHYAFLRDTVDFQNIAAFFGEKFGAVIAAAEKGDAQMSGHPSGFFWQYDTVAMNADMAAAIPLDKSIKPGNGIQVLALSGKALVIDYLGPYENTAVAHGAMEEYMAEKKLQLVPPSIEEYVTDPVQEPDTAKWLTKIIYFVKPKADSTDVKKK